ncbi:MAG: YciI family protein [Rickettsia endosymbiont of Labidopullus appendiculatus]|nr:YciI family protein [Rickettsia endosymbiont of Labidopullus appendiculatus]
MFIINLTYKTNLAVVEKFLVSHIKFLDNYYSKGYFITSGPKNPRTGGIILANIKEKEQVDSIIKEDPFYINNIADYEIIDFTPTKYHKKFVYFTSVHDKKITDREKE